MISNLVGGKFADYRKQRQKRRQILHHSWVVALLVNEVLAVAVVAFVVLAVALVVLSVALDDVADVVVATTAVDVADVVVATTAVWVPSMVEHRLRMAAVAFCWRPCSLMLLLVRHLDAVSSPMGELGGEPSCPWDGERSKR